MSSDMAAVSEPLPSIPRGSAGAPGSAVTGTVLDGLFESSALNQVHRQAQSRSCSRIGCEECGVDELVPGDQGLSCVRCGFLIWRFVGNSTVRVAWMNDAAYSASPSDHVFVCGRCGADADTEKLDGTWLCNRCDTRAAENKSTTARLLSCAEASRRLQSICRD